MAIIGVAGKIGSGKDTVGAIIQYLVYRNLLEKDITIDDLPSISEKHFNIYRYSLVPQRSDWKIIKYADKLKDIVCIILGCTREQLEDREFKETELGEAWDYYELFESHKWDDKTTRVISTEPFNNFNNIQKLTPRKLLQFIGTECGRQIIHPNIWVNATMSGYYPIDCSGNTKCSFAGKSNISCNKCPQYPNFIITDVRFPNEAKTITDKGGINIRIQKESDTNEGHDSETALDTYKFDYVVNHSTIEALIEQIKEILLIEKII